MRGARVWLGLLVATSVAFVVGAGAVPSETAPVLMPYAPIEPAELYVTEAMNETTRLWVKYSRRAALHGDLTGAIEQMQIAANTLIRSRNDDFELWDNLAELYCAKANREGDAKRAAVSRANGLAMLAEYRCGVKVFSGSAYDMSCKSKRGIVPNAAFTPLCYQLFCSEGARDRGAANEGFEEDTEDHPDVYTLYLAKFREDAANLPAIEQVCRAEPKEK